MRYIEDVRRYRHLETAIFNSLRYAMMALHEKCLGVATLERAVGVCRNHGSPSCQDGQVDCRTEPRRQSADLEGSREPV